jgi:hypothetical protein
MLNAKYIILHKTYHMLNLDFHKELSAMFEKQFNDKKELTVDWLIRTFLDYSKKQKGGLKTDAGNILLCTFATDTANLYLQIFFDADGKAKNLDMGYLEKDNFVNVWGYHRNEKEEGFTNKFDD